MATAARVLARAVSLADEHEDEFPSVGTMRARAQALIAPRRLGVVGGNGSGKSSLLNLEIQLNLVADSEAYRARGGEHQPGLSLLASRYGDWDGVLAALRDGELALQFNTRPQPDTIGARHMKMVEASLAGYYTGVRSKFGRQKTAALLPVGKTTDTTTQAAVEVLFGLEVACLILNRSPDALKEQVVEVLKSLLVLAQDETEVGELTKSREFSRQHDQFTKMTGIDVVKQTKASGEALEAVLQGLLEESSQRSLLLPDLEKLASQLKPCAFIGLRQDLGSDMRYVKDVLEEPLLRMVELCCGSEPLPPELLSIDVLGMLVEKIEVTVPCEMYELLHLLDMPGLNDTRPWANYNINQAMGSSTDLLLLVNRNLKSDESTLQAAINSGWAAHQLDSNAQGHLIVCHNPEMFSSGLNAEDLWGASYEEMAATNHATSRAVLQELMIKVAPPRLSEEEQLQAVERFLNERCHFITVAAANCVSLTLADPQDVYQRLQDEEVEMDADVNRFTAYEQLLDRTQVAKLQEVFGTISSFLRAQHLRALEDEVRRQQQILSDSEGTAEGLTIEQAKKIAPLLKSKQSDPAKLDNFVQTGKTFQPSRRGQAEVHTMQSVAGVLEARLLAGPLQRLVQYYQSTALRDASIARMAEQTVSRLKDDEKLTLPTLRRICKSSAIAAGNTHNIRNNLFASLGVAKSAPIMEQADEFLQPHREAAAGVAGVLKHNMGTFFPNGDEELLEFVKSERVWRLLEEHISTELLRVADYNLLKGEAFDAEISELLRSQLSEKLTPLSGYEVVRKFARKTDFWAPFRDALIAALKAVREQLPDLLKQRLRTHVHNELFSDDKLFMPVRSRSHGLARQEMGTRSKEQGAGTNGAQEHGDAADSAQNGAAGAAGAAAASGMTPGGRRSRAKKVPLKTQYQRQASLWRALHCWVKDAQTIVVAKDAETAQQLDLLLKRLDRLQTEAGSAVEMYSGQAGFEELRRQMGRSLLHKMLQHKRLAQVLADSPEVSVRAEPLAFEAELVQRPGGGWAMQGRTFVAELGDLSLPVGLHQDLGSLQLLRDVLLQSHKLMWRKEHPIPEGPDNALKAGYSCLTGRRLDPDSGPKKVRDIVAKQMFEEGDALAQKLEQAGLLPAPVGHQQSLAYILDFADGGRYAGLLELQELACACLKEDEAFLIWSNQRVDGGRFRAFLLPATPLSTDGPAHRTIKAFPMKLFGVMSDGVTRPLFEPLFRAPRELLSLGAPQASRQSQGEGGRKRNRTASGTLVGDSTQTAASTASGGAGPSGSAAAGGAPQHAQRSVTGPARAVRWKDENEVAAALCELAGIFSGPPDASDEAGPSKRPRR